MSEPKATKKTKASGVLILLILIVAILVSLAYFYPEPQPIVPPFKEREGIVVATIGEEPVYMEELEAFKASFPQLKDLPMATVYKQLVEAYVNKKLILSQAQKMGLQDDVQVKKILKDAEDQLLIRVYIEKKIAEQMTPGALKAMYETEIKHFEPQEEVHARHILVATEKEAKDLIVKLRAGADFATLANQYTLDRNQGGTNGGDLGYFTKDMMIPEFAKEAFALPKGQFSQKPVKTPFGWHVVKVEDKRKSSPPTYEQMLETLQAQFIEAAAKDIVEEERSAAKVTIKNLFPEPEAKIPAPVDEEPAVEVVEEDVVEETAPVAEEPVAVEEVVSETEVVEEQPTATAQEVVEKQNEEAVAVDVQVTP